MTTLEILDIKIAKVRESLEKVASQEALALIDELEMHLYKQRCILEIDYGKVKDK